MNFDVSGSNLTGLLGFFAKWRKRKSDVAYETSRKIKTKFTN